MSWYSDRVQDEAEYWERRDREGEPSDLPILPVLFTFVDVAPLTVQGAIWICAKAAPATQVVDRGAAMVIAIPEAATAEVLGGFARAGIVPTRVSILASHLLPEQCDAIVKIVGATMNLEISDR